MAPTLVREPFHRDGWIYEEKVDGYRMLAYKDGQRVRLVSRHGVDHTRRFRDLAAAVAAASKPWFRSLGPFYSSSTTTCLATRSFGGGAWVRAAWPPTGRSS
jgi:ATP dependent DNA ligase domain